ncbi:hypothetical protein [Bradyrhizobium sp. I1.7.5]|uniref:hypothetical protein n=1 Tax=Bradyrhizobium sp. I1.7.5 TaxID=3156363 RepID=UPI0033945DE9
MNGWTVNDIRTDFAALINDVAQNGLPLEDADDLADLLNHLQSEQAYVSSHWVLRAPRFSLWSPPFGVAEDKRVSTGASTGLRTSRLGPVFIIARRVFPEL